MSRLNSRGSLLFGLVVLHCFLLSAKSESFTAITHFKGLIAKEKQLTQQLQAYLRAAESRLQQIHRFAQQVTESEKHSTTNVEERLGHPTNAFRLVRRFTSGWRNVESLLADPLQQAEDLQKTIDSYIGLFPTEEDLKGAAVAVLRLQDVYQVNTSSMARGLAGAQGERLTVDDCYLLGRSAYNDEDWLNAKRWMTEVLNRLSSGELPPREINSFIVMDHLAFIEFKLGNIKRAFRLTKQLLAQDPQNGRLLSNKEAYESHLYALYKAQAEKAKQAREEGEEAKKESLFRQKKRQMNEEDFWYWRDFRRYKRLCRAPAPEKHHNDHLLRCFLTNMNRDPQLILRPAKVEVATVNPTIIIYRGVISDQEMDRLKYLADPMLNRATAHNRLTGKYEPAQYRVSKSAWLGPEHDGTGIAERVNRRIEAITGLTMTTAEQLQVVNYGIGGHYEPHFDYARHFDMSATDGNRIATLLFYMSNVLAGGCTVFPRIPARVEPGKGDASFWYNLLPSGDGDELTRHAGCPVLSGSKWVCNKWIHERGQEFRKPCKKNRFDTWDIHIPPKHL